MNIGVVIVTYNRISKLKKTLESFNNSMQKPSYLIVVNNASNDGTKEFLDLWKEQESDFRRIVINSEENTGGSGGFYLGLELARSLDSEWVWVSDDDAYPSNNSLNIASDFLDNYENASYELSAICGTVNNKEGIDLGHRRNLKRIGLTVKDKIIPLESYDKEFFYLNEFSYVGTILNRKKLEEVGVTNKDFFIHYDDTEHSLRLSKVGKIICIPKIRVFHDVEAAQNSSNKEYNISWQKYYDYRNMLYMYKEHLPSYCFLYQLLKYKIKILMPNIFHISKIEIKILNDAINDVKKGVLGKHYLYKPGWKSNED